MGASPSLFKRIVRPLVNNSVKTGESEWYPELEPMELDDQTETVLDAAVRVVEKRPRWNLVDLDEDAGRLDFEATTKRMGFVDDVTVEVHESGTGSRVVVHSRSREGKGDLGKNASRIEEFFDRLATELRMAH